jgi:hypothetical protein
VIGGIGIAAMPAGKRVGADSVVKPIEDISEALKANSTTVIVNGASRPSTRVRDGSG